MALRIGVASAYPPNRRPLSEYAWHVVESLAHNARVDEVHVFADRGADQAPPRNGIEVHQCWSFGGFDQPYSIVRAARKFRVDAVWFHTHMTSGGNTRRSQLAALLAPAVCTLAGIPTVVTLHNMLGVSDLQWARPHSSRIDVLGGHLATSVFRVPERVVVMLPEYAELMRRRYGVQAQVMPMGTLGGRPTIPVIPRPTDQPLLAFGRFGTYKRLDVVIAAIREMTAAGERVRLVIAGSDSRQTPGYLADWQQRCADLPNVAFLGYVEEADVPALFTHATACILPYATVTGMSSVATQAAMYGVPLIASDVPGVRLYEKRGLRLNFFDWCDAGSLRKAIRFVLDHPDECAAGVWHNNRYCQEQLMDDVTDQYINLIEDAAAWRRRPAEASDDMPAASRLR